MSWSLDLQTLHRRSVHGLTSCSYHIVLFGRMFRRPLRLVSMVSLESHQAELRLNLANLETSSEVSKPEVFYQNIGFDMLQ